MAECYPTGQRPSLKLSGISPSRSAKRANKDGKPDTVVAGAYGTHVFLSKPVSGATATPR
jgi:hypothetical protein